MRTKKHNSIIATTKIAHNIWIIQKNSLPLHRKTEKVAAKMVPWPSG